MPDIRKETDEGKWKTSEHLNTNAEASLLH